MIQRRGVAGRMFGPLRLPHGPVGGVPTALGGRLRHSSGAPMAKSTRDEALFPNGPGNWAWTIAPAWKSIAFAESLYAHRIFTSLRGPGVVRPTQLLRRAPTKHITAIGEPFAIAKRALEPVWFCIAAMLITVN